MPTKEKPLTSKDKEREGARTVESQDDVPLHKVAKKGRKKNDRNETDGKRAAASDQQVDEVINNQLLQLSVKSYKKLLVSADSEAMWYEQASHPG